MPDDPTKDQNQPAKPPTAEELLAMPPEKIFEMHGVKPEADVVIDVLEDPEEKAAWGRFVEKVGAEDLPIANMLYPEIIALSGVDPEKFYEGMTLDEQYASMTEDLQEYERILTDPAKARARLEKLINNPDKEPMKSYLRGTAPPAFSQAYTRLFQAAYGEVPTGIPPRKGDGFVY